VAQFMVAAELAEIQDRPPKRQAPAAGELKAALDKLLGGMGEEDAGFLLAAIKSPSGLAVKDQCKATRLYYRRLKEIAPKDALRVFLSSLYANPVPTPPR